MNLRELTERESLVAHRTLSSHAFYALVVDAICRKKPLSSIRVSDGEKAAWEYARRHEPDDRLLCLDDGFRKRFGCEGISCGEVIKRIRSAVVECSYLSPSFGFFSPAYDVLDICLEDRQRDWYIDGWYPYHWTLQMKQALFNAVDLVMVINRDYNVVHKMQLKRSQAGPMIVMSTLDIWSEAEECMKRVLASDAQLVLMSAGLASKWIGPRIAQAGDKVVLDIGQAADVWLEG